MDVTNKRKLVYILIAFAVFAALATYVFRDQLSPSATPQVSPEAQAQIDTQSSTYKQYAAMTGEEYDRNFIANMIVHHQGAVDMAKMALTNAKHVELKEMAKEIIAAQESEISQMESWQKEWGYTSTSVDSSMDHGSMGAMDHSSMGMADDMSGMMSELEHKIGDDFDKTFIEQMIIHHQSAIDMAAPGAKNAHHQELKDLTKAVVSAQTQEIQQMKQWQIDWGY